MASENLDVVGCGGCAVGTQCRFGDQCVPAEYESESCRLTCRVPKSLLQLTSTYEVLDVQGNVICRGDVPKSCCAGGGMDCDVNACKDVGDGKGACSPLNDKPAPSVLQQMSWVDRLLPVWIIGAMALGLLLGYFVPSVSASLQVVDIFGVSLPIALGLWGMMLPVLTKVRYELLHVLFKSKYVVKQFSVSFVLNWIIGPALMTALAWACLPDLPNFRNGVIMVGLARCIAMVLLWNDLAQGDPELCAVLVAFNSVMQVVLYAPLSMFYLVVVSGSSGITVSFWEVARSVLIFLGIPLVGGVLLRLLIIQTAGRRWFETKFMPWFGPVALLSLIYTIIVMFAIQGHNIIDQIGSVCRVAVPMVFYFSLMFFGSATLSWYLHMSYGYSVTQAFTASSNNFELAIAVAVATFGVTSPEALAATVGPLIEVPMLLALVYVALWFKGKAWDRRDDWLRSEGKFPPALPSFDLDQEDDRKVKVCEPLEMSGTTPSRTEGEERRAM